MVFLLLVAALFTAAASQAGSNSGGPPDVCHMIVKENRKSLGFSHYTTLESSGMNFETCKMHCMLENQCKATELRRDKCLLYSRDVTRSSPGHSVAVKWCPSDSSQRPTCRMTSVDDHSGNVLYSYRSQTGTSLEECKNECMRDYKCKATEYKSGDCVSYNQTATVASPGSTVATKTCSFDGPQQPSCRMNEVADYTGNRGFVYRTTTGSNFDECKTSCFSDDHCRATEFIDTSCFYFYRLALIRSRGSTVARKICP